MKNTVTKTLAAAVLAASFAFSACSYASDGSEGEGIVIQQYRRALELDQGNVNIHYQLGLALLKAGRYDEALEDLQVVYDSMPEDEEINYYIGMANAGAGNLDKAFEAYMKVAEGDIKKAHDVYELDKVLYNLGLAYQKESDHKNALKSYEESIRIDPEQSLAYCRKGEVLFDLKSYGDALESLGVCDSRQPGDARIRRYIISTHFARGLACLGAKKYDEALADLKKVLEIDPKNERAVYFEAYLYYQMADYRQALSAIETLRTVDSAEVMENIPPLLHNVAVEFQSREEWNLAEKALKRALEYRRTDADLHYLLGYNYMKKGEYKVSLEEMKETLRIKPDHSKANLAVAVISEKLIDGLIKKGKENVLAGNYPEALAVYNEALSIDPANKKAAREKAEVERTIEVMRHEASQKKEQEISKKLDSAENYLRDEKYREALAAYRYVLKIDPANQKAMEGAASAEDFVKEKKDAHVNRGDAYSGGQLYYLAAREYWEALAIDPDDTLIQSKYAKARSDLAAKVSPFMDEGRASEDRGDYRGAIRAYDEALKYEPDNGDAATAKARSSAALEAGFREYFGKADDALKAQDYLGAATNLRQAEKLKPEDAALKDGQARLSEGLKRFIPARLKSAGNAMKEGNYREAASIYKDVAAIDEKNAEAAEGYRNALGLLNEEVARRTELADDAYRQGRYQRAYDLYADVIAIDKDNRNAQKMRIEARRRMDADSSGILRKAVEEFNNGDMDTAGEDFKKVLASEPGNRTAKKYLSMIDKPKPRKATDKEVEKLYLKGIELYTEGKYTEAIKAWEKVLESEPRHEKAQLNIGKAKRKLEGVMDVK